MSDDSLTLPRFLPDGSSLYMDSDFLDRLHNGAPELGWVGDERLGIYMADGRIEIWRLCEDGVPRKIMQSKPGHRFLNSDTLRFLAEHDSRSRRQYDVVRETLDYNASEKARRREDARAQNEEYADRFHYALLRDIGAHEGGSRHRQMPLPAAPWKKDAE